LEREYKKSNTTIMMTTFPDFPKEFGHHRLYDDKEVEFNA